MSTETAKRTISPAFQRRLEEHRAEAARIRAEIGDPEEAIRKWVREHFDEEALYETFREEAIRGRWVGWEELKRPTDG